MNSNSKNNKQKHIVMYIGSLQRGGAEHVMVNLAEYFYGRGYKVTLATTYLERDEYPVSNGVWEEVTEAEYNANNSKKKTDTIGENAAQTAKNADAAEAESSESDYIYAKVLRPDDTYAYVRQQKDAEGIQRVFTALMPEDRHGRMADFSARSAILQMTWKTLKPDLILSFLGKNNVMALMTTMGSGIPVVVSVRSDPRREYKNYLLRMMMSSTFRNAAAVVVQTDDARSYFGAAIRSRTHVLPNSLQPSFIRSVYKGSREKTVVTVGSLRKVKNHELLIKAFAGAAEKHPEYKLMIYGEGEERQHLEELAKQLGIADKVSLPGQTANVAEAIEKAGIFVLSSDREGMPNALMEAMALGIPVISTNCPCGGPKELIKDGENGRLVPIKKVKKLQAALLEYMDDPQMAAQMGRKASQVQQDYAPSKVNGEWEKLFLSLMKK